MADDGSDYRGSSGRFARDPTSAPPAPDARVIDRSATGSRVRRHELGGRWYRPDGAPGPAWHGRLAEPAVTDDRVPRLLTLTLPAHGPAFSMWRC
jgi:hypothetical protein